MWSFQQDWKISKVYLGMTFLSVQLRSTKIIGWLYPGGEICVTGCHVTSCNQGFSSNDQRRQRRETLGTRLHWGLYPTSFPGSLIQPPSGASEERPWSGLVTCYFDNWEHQGGVLCNQAVCRVELCRVATDIISNSIYSGVYLKGLASLSRDNLPWSW